MNRKVKFSIIFQLNFEKLKSMPKLNKIKKNKIKNMGDAVTD